MLGAFRPSAPLSGGLLWKIPWRMSSPQKLRQRRRLRRVDNVVSVLDSALKRQATSVTLANPPLASSNGTADPPVSRTRSTDAPPEELSSTPVQGQPSPDTGAHSAPDSRRHGHGVKEGEGGTMPAEAEAEAARQHRTIKLIERWKAEMPTEREMLPRDKYTMFDRKARGYRKGLHKLPKWTRVSQRVNPPGF